MSEQNYQSNYMSAWGYVGYSLLFAIPIVGLVLLIVFSFSNENINRRNYARSYFCWLIIGLVLIVVAMVTGFGAGLLQYIRMIGR